jgi:hypothetical protein
MAMSPAPPSPGPRRANPSSPRTARAANFTASSRCARPAARGPWPAGRPEYLLWIRHRDPAARSLSALVALADMPPPPAMALFPSSRPISTMTWALDVVGLPDENDDGWRLMRTRAETVGEGYSTQEMFGLGRAGRR